MRESAAIGFRKNFELKFFQLSAKFSHHGTKGRQVDLFEIRSRGTELLEQAKEMIRSAANRNSRETLGFRKFFFGQQLFRGES